MLFDQKFISFSFFLFFKFAFLIFLHLHALINTTSIFLRDAVGSAPQIGDRKCYQLPPGSTGLANRAVVSTFSMEE